MESNHWLLNCLLNSLPRLTSTTSSQLFITGPLEWEATGGKSVYWPWAFAADQFHKSQNAPVPYLTMIHSNQKSAHFCSEWSIMGYGTNAFWDL